MPKYTKRSRKRASRRTKTSGRRRTMATGAALGLNTAAMAAKAAYGGLAGYQAAKALRNATAPTNHLRRRPGRKRRVKMMQAAASPAHIRTSAGLVIGKPRSMSLSEKIGAIMNPPQQFNSKWTFQMDCASARVTAAEIPILTAPLLSPIMDEFANDATTDTAAADPTLGIGLPIINQYQIMIDNYKCNIRAYNSSSNTLQARIVWYAPKTDMDGVYKNYGANTYNPINMLMLASNGAHQLPTPTAVGDGLVFDALTAGSNYNANYQHAGWTTTGNGTTSGQAANTVAYLDPSLVPGKPQVRAQFSRFWRTLKTEDFTLEPGNQFNTRLTIKNRMFNNFYDDTDVIHRKGITVIGVIYVMGQIVTDDRTLDYGISTGSSQLSILREDTCQMRRIITKRITRINLTAPYIAIATANQGIINVETNNVDDVYEQDT